MTWVHALVLGIVQGLTEFLPVSSSGHLILIPHFLGWPDQGLAFDAAMHLGTLVALLIYFRWELVGMLTGAVSRRLGVLVVVATIPGAVAGVLLDKLIEEHLRSTLLVAITTGVWALIMLVADRSARPRDRQPGDPLERVTWGQGLSVGVMQALALIPGTSRSGVTITTALFAGLDRATAARYSFLLGIPITAGAGGLKLLHILRVGLVPGEATVLTVGLVASALSGWAAVAFLVGYLKNNSLMPFIIYRLILALAILAFAIL